MWCRVCHSFAPPHAPSPKSGKLVLKGRVFQIINTSGKREMSSSVGNGGWRKRGLLEIDDKHVTAEKMDEGQLLKDKTHVVEVQHIGRSTQTKGFSFRIRLVAPSSQ